MVTSTRWDAGALAVLPGEHNDKEVVMFDFLNYSLTLLTYYQKASSNESQALALSSACEGNLSKRAENAAVF